MKILPCFTSEMQGKKRVKSNFFTKCQNTELWPIFKKWSLWRDVLTGQRCDGHWDPVTQSSTTGNTQSRSCHGCVEEKSSGHTVSQHTTARNQPHGAKFHGSLDPKKGVQFDVSKFLKIPTFWSVICPHTFPLCDVQNYWTFPQQRDWRTISNVLQYLFISVILHWNL